MAKAVLPATSQHDAHKEYLDSTIQTSLLSQETCDAFRSATQNMSYLGKLLGKIASATECLKVFYHVGKCVYNWRNGQHVKKDIIDAGLSIGSAVCFCLGSFLALPSGGLATVLFYGAGYGFIATYQTYNHKHYKATREQVIQDDIARLEAEKIDHQRCYNQNSDQLIQTHHHPNLEQINTALRQAKTAQQQVEQEKAQKNKPSRSMRHMIYEGIAAATVTAGTYIISAGVSLGVAASNVIWGVASVATLAQIIDSPIPGKIKRGFKKGFQKAKQALTGVKQDDAISTQCQFKDSDSYQAVNDQQPEQQPDAYQPKNSWWQRFKGWFTTPKPASETMSDKRCKNPALNNSIQTSEQQIDTTEAAHQEPLDNDTISIENKLQSYARVKIKDPHNNKSRQQSDKTLNHYLKLLIDRNDVNGLRLFIDEVCEFAIEQANKILNLNNSQSEKALQERQRLQKQQIYNCLKRFDQIIPALEKVNERLKNNDQLQNEPKSESSEPADEDNQNETIKPLKLISNITFFRGDTDFDFDIGDPQERQSPISPRTEPGSCSPLP